MNAADYFTAAIPEPFQILGLRLKPFCLGHYFLMRRFEVAFASESNIDAGLDDLILGALICSMTYEGFLEWLAVADIGKEIADWGGKCGLDFDFASKVKLFNNLLEAAFRQPVVIYEADSNHSGAHWAQVVKIALISQCGYSESEAMNLPLAQAFADFYKNAENNGVLSIATDEVAELLRENGD